MKMKVEPLTEPERSRVAECILGGRKIDAIKIYRESTGLGLKDAKEGVEKITRELAKQHPELAKAQSKGCAALFLTGLIITGAAAGVISKLALG